MLKSTENGIFELFNEFQIGRIDRRTFISRLALISSAVIIPISACSNNDDNRNPEIFSRDEWEILKKVQEHLFPPTTDFTGANGINAAAWLQNLVSDKNNDPEESEFIKKGITWLEESSIEIEEKSFLKLSFDQREDVLRQIEKDDWGERWISLILLYIFESLLSDPLYGANPDGIGWKWLDHTPGYPRPTNNKMYGKL